jgi:protein-tyrosine phosphatase
MADMFWNCIFWVHGQPPPGLAVVLCPKGGWGLRDTLRLYQRGGIQTLVSLLEDKEAERLGLADEGRIARKIGMEFLSHPMPDHSLPPDAEAFQAFVAGLAARLCAGERIGVHCFGSIGRATVTAACALIELGWEPGAALTAIEKARLYPVPDTEEQQEWILGYKSAQATQAIRARAAAPIAAPVSAHIPTSVRTAAPIAEPASAPMVDFSFPHRWQADILAECPLILPPRHFVYPRQAEEVERGALEVMIRPGAEGAQPFLATCALGFRDSAAPTGLWSTPNPAEICAVSGGYAYLIDTAAPERFTMIPFRPVLEVRPVVAQGLLLFVGHHAILAWGANGQAWQSEKLSDEGVTITAIEASTLYGTAWQMKTDRETIFALDLRTGLSVS